MTDFVLEVINSHDLSIQTNTDVNFVLRSSGQFSDANFNTTSQYYNHAYMDISSMNAPLVFFRPMTSNSRIAYIPGIQEHIAGANGATQKRGTVLKWYNLTMGTMQYYIFDQWVPPERSDYGIQAFDGSGNIIFDAGWNFMKVVNIKWLDPGFPNHSSDPGGSNWTSVGTMGAGTLAGSMPNPRGWIYQGLGTFGIVLYESFHFDGASNEVMISLVPRGEYLDEAPATGWMHDASLSHVMAVDVSSLPTNYNSINVSPS